MAARSPACASLVTRRTLVRSRASGSRKNASQSASSSPEVTWTGEDVAVALGVDAGGDQAVHVDHAAVLAHFQHQLVGGHERVRPLIYRAGAERFDLGIQIPCPDRYLGLGQAGDSTGSTRPAGSRSPPRWSGRVRRVCGVRAASPGSGCLSAVSGSPHRRADAGVEVAVAVAVAGGDPFGRTLAVAGAADRVGLGTHERLDERGEHVAQQIRAASGELVGERLVRVDSLNSEPFSSCGGFVVL
jgi:hypothetical protein